MSTKLPTSTGLHRPIGDDIEGACPPRQVGPYRLLERVGKGAMAEVFKAEHRHLGQIRGLKVLLPEVAAQPDLLSRLLNEARTMARLRHPNIAEVYDCDVQGGSAFIVMEYLPGVTLATWCDHVGKLARAPGLAVAVAGTLAGGLAYAHRHGVVHRDLKPENVLLVPAGEDQEHFSLKIVDFGVAKLVREQAVEPGATSRRDQRSVTTTEHGCIVGTPVYMAPEQWRAGTAIDHRADIYALGCLLFELLCGRPPFCQNEPSAIMAAHLCEPPPDPTALEPDLPPRFAKLMARMLAKAPEQRHASMEEVLTELEAISGHPRASWKTMLRTPAARVTSVRGAMAVPGTLVIDVGQTMVERSPLAPLLNVLQGLRRLRQVWPTKRLLPGLLARLLPRVLQALGSVGRAARTRRARRVVLAGVWLTAAGVLVGTTRLSSTTTRTSPAPDRARPALRIAPVVPAAPRPLPPDPAAAPAPPPPESEPRPPAGRDHGSHAGARSHPSNLYRPVKD